METPRISSYREFWDFYVGEHAKPATRLLHFIGTTCVIASVFAGILISPRFFFLTPFVGYGCAWWGHYGFEKNRPATFQYPLWSLCADFQMWAFMLTGRMGREIARAGKS